MKNLLKRKKKWMGTIPEKCDLCATELEVDGCFVDGKTVFGPWGILCLKCHRARGVGLGTGVGQKYDLLTLEKIDG